MRNIKYILLVSAVLCLIVFHGCSIFEGIGSDLGEGLMSEVEPSADTIGANLIKGIVRELNSSESRAKLDSLLDNLITRLGYNTNAQVKGLRDSLLNDYVNKWVSSVVDDAIGNVTRGKLGLLRDELLGYKTIGYLGGMRDELIGYQSREMIRNIVAGMRDELLSDTTSVRVGGLRDVLLGARTQTALNAIVNSIIDTFLQRYRDDVRPELNEDVGFLQKNVTTILIVAGVIVLVIIWFIWRQKQKYLKLTRLLTSQIYTLPDKTAKEKLKDSIKKNALETGLEVDLRKELSDQGILSRS